MAPEKISAYTSKYYGQFRRPFSGEEQKKQDIYSLGISIIEMLPTLPHSYLEDFSTLNSVDRHNAIHNMLLHNERNKHRTEFSDITMGTGSLLLRMTSIDPRVRPTAEEVVNFFEDLCEQIKIDKEKIRDEEKIKIKIKRDDKRKTLFLACLSHASI